MSYNIDCALSTSDKIAWPDIVHPDISKPPVTVYTMFCTNASAESDCLAQEGVAQVGNR